MTDNVNNIELLPVVNQKPETTVPIPAAPITDVLSRIIEVGNDRKGRVDSFLQRFEEEHPYAPESGNSEAVMLSTKDTPDGTEYCFRFTPRKKGEKLESIKVRLKGERTLDGESTPASKMLQLILARMLQAGYNIHKNAFVNPEILVTPAELVALGIYDSVGSALTHLDNALAKVASILLKVAVRADGGQTTMFIPLIRSWKHDGKHWIIRVEDELPFWALLLPIYTRFPVIGFKLKHRAFSTLRYIMTLANLNKGRLVNDGYFVITVDSLINRLFLNKNDRHKKDALVIPAQNAIEEINKLDCGVRLSVCNNNGMPIALINEGDVYPTQDFLNGKILVSITPELFAEFQTKKQLKTANKGGKK